MAPRPNFNNRLEQTTSLRVDPRVILAAKILQLNQVELDQTIEAELCENPALERIQDDTEPIDRETILKTVAPCELKFDRDDNELYRSLPKDDEHFDWLDLASSSTTLREHLHAQMMGVLPNHLENVGHYLVEAVDDRGYLTMPLEECALLVDCSLEEVEEALAQLRKCEPAGVGAYNLQECLLLQLRDAQGQIQKLARHILKHYLDEFIARKAFRLAKKLKVSPDDVEEAFELILSLNPYPGEGFCPSSGYVSNSTGVGISPDLSISRTEEGWQVEVKGVQGHSLIVNRAYSERLNQLQGKLSADKEEQKHLSSYVQRANDFINSINQRRKTLKLVGEYLIQFQASFISTGSYQFLQPLTRAQIAKAIGVHESTVSRATQDKFVQIATGEILPFEVFFKPALRVQKMIEEILKTENPDNPISDDRIAQLLEEKGVSVARRTVNKYRDKTKLLSSRKRRGAA